MITKITNGLILYLISFTIISIYTLLLYFIGSAIWPDKAGGSIITSSAGQVRGSFLLGQDFQYPGYFMGRPKQLLNNQCNLQFYLGEYKNLINQRVNEYKGDIKYAELLVPSASLLDPYISLEAALSQVHDVAKVRNIPEAELEAIVHTIALKSQWPFFSMNIVNTVRLNEALCKITTCQGF